jgi:hypothetical protein
MAICGDIAREAKINRLGVATTLIFVVAGANRVISFPIRSGDPRHIEGFKPQLNHGWRSGSTSQFVLNPSSVGPLRMRIPAFAQVWSQASVSLF